MGLIPGWGTKIQHVVRHGQKKKKKELSAYPKIIKLVSYVFLCNNFLLHLDLQSA